MRRVTVIHATREGSTVMKMMIGVIGPIRMPAALAVRMNMLNVVWPTRSPPGADRVGARRRVRRVARSGPVAAQRTVERSGSDGIEPSRLNQLPTRFCPSGQLARKVSIVELPVSQSLYPLSNINYYYYWVSTLIIIKGGERVAHDGLCCYCVIVSSVATSVRRRHFESIGIRESDLLACLCTLCVQRLCSNRLACLNTPCFHITQHANSVSPQVGPSPPQARHRYCF
jgi:hypothetical protein